MATNRFINNFNFTTEQTVYEDLIIESIQFYGMDLIYMPRKDSTPDTVFTEEVGSVFEETFTIEMYLKSVLDFSGAGDTMSKFGLQIQDQARMVVAIRRFNEVFGNRLIRPREGDMLYVPILGEIYEIKFVEHEAIFHAFGALQTYELDIELATYDNLVFNTGNTTIDSKAARMTLDRNVINNGSPVPANTAVQSYDANAQNENLEGASDDIVDFSEIDPFTGGIF
jgi:hypothetical protein